ncbi:transglycosylase domain-containing protein [Paenibacillus sp. FSL H7-0331]|uniref:transglycosylase domain-containing protein n=1 Tax=Paenibacillus sp. FSL H7-0331 TaxID=1920421 RepID=UPI00096EAF99|nr:PBP1A family penicillin-binding protein [Paenibacillus sp. FSL H7-0331]OMF19876.1 penicillin-binding protein [Paenibacillus sp. FSL H7-0331]
MATDKKTTAAKPPAKKTPAKKKKKKFSFGKALMFAFVTAVLGIICALGVYIFIIINGNKILDANIDKLDMDEASHLFDVNGTEVAVLHGEHDNREIVKPEEIPTKLQQAFIATEDRRFEQHTGIDFLGIGRALVKDVVARSAVEGGSTITQQVAKNMFLNNNKTFFRKATEMSIAVALEDRKTKDEILALYVNRIFFGNRVFGVKAAAKKYFNVSELKDLKIWQMATLAAIPKAPSVYNPIANPDKSKERRAVVLKLMQDQGYITEAERAEAAAVDYEAPPATGNKDYLTFIDYAINEAEKVYGIPEAELLSNGYKIYTTMDSNAQKIMEQTFANDKFFQKNGPEQKMQGAMAIINHKDGGVVGIIGGRDYVQTGLDRAVVPQQPGSSIKPLLIYAPALESGKYNPYSMLEDKEANYNGYAPRNYDGVYRGQVDMFEAVRKSINAPAVWLFNEIGVKTGMDFASKLGIPFEPQKDRNLAIALGGMTKGASPLQMAAAYGAIANNGYLNTTHSIIKIVDDQGALVKEFKQERVTPAMSAKTAYYMTLLMQSVVEPGGTGTAAKFERPVSGKTGSTQTVIKGLEKYNRDLWFTGFTPEWSAAVWIGFDKSDAKHYVTMSSGSAAVIFKEVMQKALANRPMTKFVKPDGVPDLVKPELPPPVKDMGELKAEYVKSNGGPSVVLSWPSLGDNVTYRLLRKTDKDKEFSSEPMLTTTQIEVKDITVKSGETYQYSVVAYDPKTEKTGTQSPSVTVVIPADGALPPGQVPGQGPGTTPGAGTTPGTGTKPGTGTGTTPGAGTGTTPGAGTGTTPGAGTGTTPGAGTGTTPGGGTGTTPGAGTGTTPGAGTGTTPGGGTGTTPGAGTGTIPGAGTGTTPGTGTGTTPGTGTGTTPGAGTGTTPGAGTGTTPGAGTGTTPGTGTGTTPGTGTGTTPGAGTGTTPGAGTGTTPGTGTGAAPGAGTVVR